MQCLEHYPDVALVDRRGTMERGRKILWPGGGGGRGQLCDDLITRRVLEGQFTSYLQPDMCQHIDEPEAACSVFVIYVTGLLQLQGYSTSLPMLCSSMSSLLLTRTQQKPATGLQTQRPKPSDLSGFKSCLLNLQECTLP